MSNVAILLHGFNVRDGGEATTDSIIPHLIACGITPIEFDYGYLSLRDARKKDYILAGYLNEAVRDYKRRGHNVIVIAHSNGATISYLAGKMANKAETPRMLALVNPALEDNIDFSEYIEKVLVFHSRHDEATAMAKLLSFFIPRQWQAKRPWGDMGNVGYRGLDPRVENVNIEFLTGTFADHNTIFQTSEGRALLVSKIVDTLETL